ncbi:MAG: YopX family protein [Anaerostipes caccae]|jgi:hypothetical protein
MKRTVRVWDDQSALEKAVMIYSGGTEVKNGIRYEFGFDPEGSIICRWQRVPNCSTERRTGSIKMVMLSSGVSDANGTAIYEGDILRISNELLYADFLCTVTYHDGAFLLRDPQHKHYQEYLRECCNDGIAMEVIGNVYETPYLIGRERRTL